MLGDSERLFKINYNCLQYRPLDCSGTDKICAKSNVKLIRCLDRLRSPLDQCEEFYTLAKACNSLAQYWCAGYEIDWNPLMMIAQFRIYTNTVARFDNTREPFSQISASSAMWNVLSGEDHGTKFCFSVGIQVGNDEQVMENLRQNSLL